MTIIERDILHLLLQDDLRAGSRVTSIKLASSNRTRFTDVSWTLAFPLPNAYRIILESPGRPRPPHDNVKVPGELYPFTVCSIDAKLAKAVFAFPDTKDAVRLQLRLSWSQQLVAEVWDVTSSEPELVLGDLSARSYAFTDHGVIRHWRFDKSRLHLGLGEKAAPIDLTGRSFRMHATDAAWYDPYLTDPLYKVTPFLISTPRPDVNGKQGSSWGIFQASNSMAVWDVGRETDYPSGGRSMSWTQDWGGLEEWVMAGQGVESITQTFAELAGKPMLVGRDWLGYLGSTMLLSDEPDAQKQLESWPSDCKKYDIPCSAMHLSSGFTVDEASGERWVFHLNKKRYPDFKDMVRVFHESGMKVVPNVKPYMLQTHPSYAQLEQGNGLFLDPSTGGPAVQNIWSSEEGVSANGSWIDLSAQSSFKWWKAGIDSLIDLGVDGIWDDNSEYFTRDDEILFKCEFGEERSVHTKGPTCTGLVGRTAGTEMMNKASHDALVARNPERRPFVVTRSGNVATFKYACSTWSGDNETGWEQMRGSQAIQLNSALSLMQSYGSDVGGFCGDLPSPELFVRWIQLGVTHSRFCIHSNTRTISGAPKLSLPWMYPEVLPIIRENIKWRYEMLPYFNTLMWKSHLEASPANAPLFYGPFAGDAQLYTKSSLKGFDAWLGVGSILTAPALYEGMFSRSVYFPKTSSEDKSLYFDLNSPHGRYAAGTTAVVATPLDHHGMFAREGAMIPIGKPMATVTATSGLPRTHGDGVETILERDGGVVSEDDFRGLLLFPGDEGVYKGDWIEDDGVSAQPAKAVFGVQYVAKGNKPVEVSGIAEESGFRPLWKGEVHIILPADDARVVVQVKGEKIIELPTAQWRGRTAYVLSI